MKLVALALSIALTAGAASAQTAPAPAAAAPAGAPAAATAKFTLDTPIETIAADPTAKAVLDANVPGTTTHPSYDMFKAMSLRQVAPMSQGVLTDEMLAKTEKALAEIK